MNPPLTPEQYAALKTDITVTHAVEFAPLLEQGNHNAIAQAYNVFDPTDFWVWRTSITTRELYEATSSQGTTWSWTTYKTAPTAVERECWVEMTRSGALNPSLPQVRNSITNDIFAGPVAAVVAQRNHIFWSGSRKPRRAERLFATGTGTLAAPALMTAEGTLTPNEVQIALQ
jgi:hypothetical protein